MVKKWKRLHVCIAHMNNLYFPNRLELRKWVTYKLHSPVKWTKLASLTFSNYAILSTLHTFNVVSCANMFVNNNFLLRIRPSHCILCHHVRKTFSPQTMFAVRISYYEIIFLLILQCKAPSVVLELFKCFTNKFSSWRVRWKIFAHKTKQERIYLVQADQLNLLKNMLTISSSDK